MIVRVLFVVLSIAAPIAILATAVARAGLDPGELLRILPPVAHAGAFAAALTSLAGRAVRACMVAGSLGERLTFGAALHAQLVADAAGFVTPARVGSEAGKLLVLHRAGVGVVSGAAINMAEVVCEAGTLAVLVLFVLVVLPLGEALPAVGALSYTCAVAATTCGSLWLARLPGERPPSLWQRLKLSTARWQQLHCGAGGFLARAIRLSRLGFGTFVLLFTVSAANIVARLAILPALVGTTSGILWPLVVWPALLLYGGAIVPAPGGGGAIELGFMAALDTSFSPAALVATLFWWRIYAHYLTAALGGLVFLFAVRLWPGTRPRTA